MTARQMKAVNAKRRAEAAAEAARRAKWERDNPHIGASAIKAAESLYASRGVPSG